MRSNRHQHPVVRTRSPKSSSAPVSRDRGLSGLRRYERPAPRRFTHCQVLLCRGPRCTGFGANQVATALSERLAEHDLGDDDVLVTATGCLFPCNLGR